MSKKSEERFKKDCLEVVIKQAKACQRAAESGVGVEFMRLYSAKAVPGQRKDGSIALSDATVRQKTDQLLDLLYGWDRKDVIRMVSEIAARYGGEVNDLTDDGE